MKLSIKLSSYNHFHATLFIRHAGFMNHNKEIMKRETKGTGTKKWNVIWTFV
jgi:hypothetical protein